MGYRKPVGSLIPDVHRNIDQEEGADPHSRTLAKEEEHLDQSHKVELGHTHM